MRSRATQNHPPDLPIGQVAPYLPKTVAETATIGHTERPTESDLLNVPAYPFTVFQAQPHNPLPHGTVAEGGFIKERRELLGTVEQF